MLSLLMHVANLIYADDWQYPSARLDQTIHCRGTDAAPRFSRYAPVCSFPRQVSKWVVKKNKTPLRNANLFAVAAWVSKQEVTLEAWRRRLVRMGV